MTDTQLVTDFLDRYYEVAIQDTGYSFIDKVTGEVLPYTNFVHLLRKIFSEFVGKDGTAFGIFTKWFDFKKIMLVQDLMEYLGECTLSLESTNWVVHRKDGVSRDITNAEVLKHFGNKYTQKFIDHYYNEWYHNEAIKISEKMFSTY